MIAFDLNENGFCLVLMWEKQVQIVAGWDLGEIGFSGIEVSCG